MTLVDGDTVDTTNRNRQLPALASTVGKIKTQVRRGVWVGSPPALLGWGAEPPNGFGMVDPTMIVHIEHPFCADKSAAAVPRLMT